MRHIYNQHEMRFNPSPRTRPDLHAEKKVGLGNEIQESIVPKPSFFSPLPIPRLPHISSQGILAIITVKSWLIRRFSTTTEPSNRLHVYFTACCLDQEFASELGTGQEKRALGLTLGRSCEVKEQLN